MQTKTAKKSNKKAKINGNTDIIPLKELKETQEYKDIKSVKLPSKVKGATMKQVKATKALIDNQGNVSKAMISAGYSKSSAKVPSNLTNSNGFKMLVEQYLPDELLQSVHLQGLKATKTELRIEGKENGQQQYTYKPVIDHNTRHKYLHTAYKLKAKYPKEDTHNTNIAVVIKAY